MKRLVITGPRQAKFEDVEMPVCPSDGVVVRARLTAISTGTELRVFRAIPVDEAGQFLHERVPFQLPVENGYSMVADVTEVGADVRGVEIGQRVFARAPHKQFAAVAAEHITPLPETIPDEEAVMLSVLEVAHKALRQGEPPAGGNVAIVGQGVIGLALTAYADAFGFRTAVLDMEPARLEIARQMGVLLAASPTDESATGRIVDLFAGEGADVAFEAASNWSGIRTAMEVTRTDGKVVVVSRHTAGPDFNPVGHPFLGKRLNVITSYGYPPDDHRWSYRRSVDLTIDLLARRRLKVRPMLTHHFSSHELPDVYRRLDQGDRIIVGAIIKWDETG
jgi:threonine dehydrogenase-like Zn-dependent dehydrogenase